jgi:NAD(P)-dependent dehydrogenase (short-subunit alcohol dehydrogenase family)
MKIAVITGARGGVASAVALRLRDEGFATALVSRDASSIEASTADLKVSADVSTPEGAAAAFDAVRAHFGAVASALVHCAGNTIIAPIARTKAEQYRQCMSANIDSAFFTTQCFLTQLSEDKLPGSIVLFSSVVAGMGVGNHAAIAAAKGAIESLTRSLAADYAAQNVRVNCIAPGLMRSPMTQRMLGSESAEKQVSAQYPLGFFGETSDAANAVAFLVTEQSRWITGQILHLDGGFSAIRPFVKI